MMETIRCTTDLNRSFDYDFEADQTVGEEAMTVKFTTKYWAEIETRNIMCSGLACEDIIIRRNTLGG